MVIKKPRQTLDEVMAEAKGRYEYLLGIERLDIVPFGSSTLSGKSPNDIDFLVKGFDWSTFLPIPNPNADLGMIGSNERSFSPNTPLAHVHWSDFSQKLLKVVNEQFCHDLSLLVYKRYPEVLKHGGKELDLFIHVPPDVSEHIWAIRISQTREFEIHWYGIVLSTVGAIGRSANDPLMPMRLSIAA